MSNEEHLFENAIYAIKNHKTYEEWLEWESPYNKLGVSNDVIEALWMAAVYVNYTHDIDRLDEDNAISIEWLITKTHEHLIERDINGSEMKFIKKLIKEWRDETGYRRNSSDGRTN